MAQEQTFFPGAIRKVIATNYVPLQSKANEKRKKVSFSDELDGDSLVGMPQWVGAAFDTVAADDCETPLTTVHATGLKLKGMTIEVYPTPSSPRALNLTQTTISNFVVERHGLGEKAKVFLRYVVHTPDSKALHAWLDENYKTAAFLRFTATQGEIDLTAEVKPGKTDDPKLFEQEVVGRVRKAGGGKGARVN